MQDLPAGFQWLGLSQAAYPIAARAIVAALLFGAVRLGAAAPRGRPGGLRRPGRMREAARLAGLDTRAVKLVGRSRWLGALTGLAALLNAVRFNQIPSNAGIGLEMKVIAAVVVGGAAITGGRGTSPARCSASSCSARSARR